MRLCCAKYDTLYIYTYRNVPYHFSRRFYDTFSVFISEVNKSKHKYQWNFVFAICIIPTPTSPELTGAKGHSKPSKPSRDLTGWRQLAPEDKDLFDEFDGSLPLITTWWWAHKDGCEQRRIPYIKLLPSLVRSQDSPSLLAGKILLISIITMVSGGYWYFWMWYIKCGVMKSLSLYMLWWYTA